ncbi:MAG: IS4 family transposase [Tepidisphaeraceae bacterium]
MATWGETHFGGLMLGDKRRSERLPKLMDALLRHPGGTLPAKLSEPGDLKAFYRMMKAEEVTHEAVLATHYAVTQKLTAEACASGAVVLILHDATELDFTSKTTLLDQLGQIGQGTHRGYICHNSLAVRADTKAALGLASQILHHRADVPKGETVKQKREREDRESRLWVQGAEQSGPLPPAGLVVDVSDSLSDTFEYMSFEIRSGRYFVLRSRENRKLLDPVNERYYLHEAVRAQESVLEWDLKIPSGPGRSARTAHLKLSFTPVTLDVPGKHSGEYPKDPLSMWAVRVWEPHAPKGVDPLEWILLTNVPVTTAAEARERVTWYEARFVIEELHKGMKTGCGIELLQLTRIERLEPAIGILSALSTTLLQLRDAARAPDADTRPATEVVDAEYVEVLTQHYRTRLTGTVTVKKFYMHVARLGGHQNRKGDGFPGWLTLWRGWMRLEEMTTGYRLGRRESRKTCGQT